MCQQKLVCPVKICRRGPCTLPRQMAFEGPPYLRGCHWYSFQYGPGRQKNVAAQTR